MTTTPLTMRGAGPERGSTLLLGAAVVLVVADAVVPLLLGVVVDGLLHALTVLALIASAVAGAVLIRDGRTAGLGRLLIGIALVGAVWDLCGWLGAVGPFGFLAGIVYWGWAGLIIHLVLRWPDERIVGRMPRLLLIAAYALMPAVALLWQVTWDPRWFDSPIGWWFTVLPARAFSGGVYTVMQVASVILIAAVVVVLLTRTAAARGRRRAAMAPVAVIAAVLAAAVAVDSVKSLGVPLPLDTLVLQNLALLAIPVAVLVAAVRRPLSDAGTAEPGRRRTSR